MFKKILYSVIKLPIILIFLKTPLIKILEQRFTNYVQVSRNNWADRILSFLDSVYQKEYFMKLQSPHKARELIHKSVTVDKGLAMAQYYYDKHFKNIDELNNRTNGLLSYSDANIIYKKIINFVKNFNLQDNEDTFFIQIGSCSGRDLEFFYNLFPKFTYISTDITDEILNFQKEKYNYKNFHFFKCYAEDIDQCFKKFHLENKKIIIFSNGSLQYVVPGFLNQFFKKISQVNDIHIFLSEPISLSFFDSDKKFSEYRGATSFSHNYINYIESLKVVETNVKRPYSKKDPSKDIGHFYIHLSS
jgi:hypothetical protein